MWETDEEKNYIAYVYVLSLHLLILDISHRDESFFFLRELSFLCKFYIPILLLFNCFSIVKQLSVTVSPGHDSVAVARQQEESKKNAPEIEIAQEQKYSSAPMYLGVQCAECSGFGKMHRSPQFASPPIFSFHCFTRATAHLK